MSNTTWNYGTITGSNYGIVVSPGRSEEKPKTPGGLIVTQAVQNIDGWRGQVIVDKTVVWESDPVDDGEAAVQAANTHIVEWLTEALKRRDG